MKFSADLCEMTLFHTGSWAWAGQWWVFSLLCEHVLRTRCVLLNFLLCCVLQFVLCMIHFECIVFLRSRSRSRRRSRTRSRSRSRSRHSRSRSRRRSYTRSRSRSRSRSDSKSSRGKSRSRSKSPRESKSKSRSKSKWTGNNHCYISWGLCHQVVVLDSAVVSTEYLTGGASDSSRNMRVAVKCTVSALHDWRLADSTPNTADEFKGIKCVLASAYNCSSCIKILCCHMGDRHEANFMPRSYKRWSLAFSV